MDAITGIELSLTEDARNILVNNRMRRAIAEALAISRLQSEDPAQRMAAAAHMQQVATPSNLPFIDQALMRETDAPIIEALTIAKARLQLESADPAQRIQAIETLGNTGNGAFKPLLLNLLKKDNDGSYVEQNESVRHQASAAIAQIDSHLKKIELAGNLFYGLSLGSVLLLAALGLAITFGLMGVINMAHGELLMIGAYASYLTQQAFQHYAPSWINWY